MNKNAPPDNQKVIPEGIDTRPGGRFLRLLLEHDQISPDKVDKAMRVQARLKTPKTLSHIMIELGYLSEDDHRRLLRRHGSALRVGELLVELGFITLAQLEQAEARLAPRQRMGDLLISLGFINDRQLAQALSEQLDIPLIHLDPSMIDADLLQSFSIKFLKTHMAIPIEANERAVLIATSEPLDNPAVPEIGRHFGKKARLRIVPSGTLNAVFDKLQSGASVRDKGEHIGEIVDSILLAAIRDQASDIHIEPLSSHTRIRFRMDGVLIHRMDLPTSLAQRVIARIKVLSEMDISDSRSHQDGRFGRNIMDSSIDFRVSSYVTMFGENIVIRILRKDGGLKSIEQIGMASGLLDRFKHDALDVPAGVIIITGPTGSGKTTTLYAGIDYLNRPSTKIITLEDPVEYVINGIMQCSVDVKGGRTFEDSLKAMVRQDPDVIVLGEVRDRRSAEVAVQAALTGHKVLTTFHTEDSIGGLLRLIDMGIETFLISSTVISILAQRLIRRICPDCRQAYMPNKRIANQAGIDDETLKNHMFYRGTGCGTCYGTGYHGRTTLHELLVLNEEVRSAILQKKTSHEVRQISCRSTDLLSLMECGVFKVLQGETTIEEVYRVAPRSLSGRSVAEICRLMEGET
ncbi:MAG: ATPase, T2SS/T4P/T4SS family [Mariprofundaceae bacterium]